MQLKTHTFLLSLIAIAMMARAVDAEPYKLDPGPRTVATLKATWHDPSRNRDIPILICYPKDLGVDNEIAPVIIFSHGLGGSREGYQPYGMHWASYGYVVIFPQHHGSDTAVIGHGMMQMLMGEGDLQPFLDRVGDIHFVLDQIEAINAGKIDGPEYQPFKEKLDLAKIGMSGHSFGAITTEAIAGEKYSLDKEGKLSDPRIKAAIAMSGSGSKDSDQDQAFGHIKIPMFYLTGTEDKIGNVGAAQRRTPFDHSTFKDTFLVTFTGANHMTFSPRQSLMDVAHKDKFQAFIRQGTTAFWDAYLKGDEKAKTWFTDQFPKELGDSGVFEKK